MGCKGAVPGEQEDPPENRGWAFRRMTASQHSAWNVSLAGGATESMFPSQKEKGNVAFPAPLRGSAD